MPDSDVAKASNGAGEAGLGPRPFPPDPPRAPRLDSPSRVRHELARTYRRAASGQVDWAVACKAGYLLSLLHRMLDTAELSDLAERVAALEART